MKMKMLFLLSLLPLSLTLSACSDREKDVKGNGQVITQTRNVNGFDSIHVSRNLQLSVSAGKPDSLKIITDANLMQYITTQISENTLSIMVRPGIVTYSKRPIKVFVTLPRLNGLDISGASNTIAKNIDAQQFIVSISGASRATLQGKAQNAQFIVSGASQLRARHLLTHTALVDVSGASAATVNASHALSGSASGAGRLSYIGKPKTQLRTSGAAQIHNIP